MSDYANDVLVDADWLQEHLNDDSHPHHRGGREPCAVQGGAHPRRDRIRLERRPPGPRTPRLPRPEEFGELFGRHGVSNDHTIVVYGDRNNWFAAYTYWYLKYYGHDKVLLLNGPREKWIADGRPTSTDVPAYSAASFLAQPGDEAIRARREEVLAAIDSSTKLVDVRSPAGVRRASSSRRRATSRRAHSAPGTSRARRRSRGPRRCARTARSSRPMNSSALYGAKGVLNGEPIIAYCRIGERSAHTWFVLHELLGREDVKNYDGSWTEWGNLVGVPVESRRVGAIAAGARAGSSRMRAVAPQMRCSPTM